MAKATATSPRTVRLIVPLVPLKKQKPRQRRDDIPWSGMSRPHPQRHLLRVMMQMFGPLSEGFVLPTCQNIGEINQGRWLKLLLPKNWKRNPITRIGDHV